MGSFNPKSDLDLALTFFKELDDEYIVLVVDSRQDIPYLRRGVYKVLGVPSKAFADELWYGKRCIRLAHVREETKYLGVEEYLVFKIDTWEVE